MISSKSKYALRAILYLAVHSNDKTKKSIRDLSEELKIPAPYLAKILQELVPKHIVSSTKGPNGGFYLTDQNLQVSLLKIVEAIDGLAVFNSCGLGLPECSEHHPCPIHNDFKISREYLKNVFSSKSVKVLSEEMKKTDAVLVI